MKQLEEKGGMDSVADGAVLMHTSPLEYLYHVRVKAAINLLKTTELPITEVASRVGYQTLSSFNRHFRRIAGASPRDCRRGG